MPLNGRNFLHLLAELKRITKNKILTNASIELAKQKVLHQFWTKNILNIQKLNEITKEIEENREKIAKILLLKQDEIQQHELEKQQLEQRSKFDFTRLM